MNRMLSWVRAHRYCLAGTYLFVFLLGFLLLELFVPEPKYILHCAADDWIPFNEWFVLPYFLWYGWVPAFMIYFMFRDRTAYLRLCFILFVGATLCLGIYLVLPNGLDLRREIAAENFCADMIRMIRAIDPPANVCPSLHVSSTVAIHLTILRAACLRDRPWMKGLSLAVTLLICISTMFIKQHSLIDVVCGWLLSLVLARISDRIWKRA